MTSAADFAFAASCCEFLLSSVRLQAACCCLHADFVVCTIQLPNNSAQPRAQQLELWLLCAPTWWYILPPSSVGNHMVHGGCNPQQCVLARVCHFLFWFSHHSAHHH